MPKKDYHIEDGKIISNVLGVPIGKIRPDGSVEGKDPWNNNDIIVARNPDELRAIQRALADEDF